MIFRIALQMAKINLVQLIRDRRAVIMLFVMPIVLIAILGNAFSSIFGGEGIPRYPVAVVNQDAGPMGAKLVSFMASQTKQMTIIKEPSVEAARKAVAAGTADVVVSIPSNYSASLKTDAKAQVDIEGALNHDTQKSVTQGMIKAYGQQMGVITNLQQQDALAGHSLTVQTVDIHNKAAGIHAITSGPYYAIGMMVMFLLTNAINRSANMVEQRSTDLYRRLIASPASRIALTVGNWVANFTVLFVQGTVLLAMARWLLSIHFGPVLQTGVLVAAYAFALSGLSIALGSLFSNRDFMNNLSNIGSTVAAALGGSIVPVYNFPHVMQIVAHVLPNGIVVTALVDSVMGVSTSQLVSPLLYLVAIGLVFGIVASTRYGRRLA